MEGRGTLLGVLAGAVAGIASAVALVGNTCTLAGALTIFAAGFAAGASVAAHVAGLRSKRDALPRGEPPEREARG